MGLIEAGLLLPQGNVNLGDLVVARQWTVNNIWSKLYLILIGDILEIGAFVSIRSRDVPSFDRYFAQLQTFYVDYRYPLISCTQTHIILERFISESLPASKREYAIRGLNLIRLLTQNRIADFHTTLESLDADVIAENPFIRHPVNLERWLMEGSYSKVWNAREEAPAEEYKFFVDSLMGTIRSASHYAEALLNLINILFLKEWNC